MADARNIPFGCVCGSLAGHVKGTHPQFRHAHRLRMPELRDGRDRFHRLAPGPSGADIYWIAPDRIVFDTGLDHLGAEKLSKNSTLLR